MSIDLEVDVSVINNAEAMPVTVGEYGAEVAKEYADKAKEYAAQAEASKNLSEAWANASIPPTVEGSRSSKTWAGVARDWAESDHEPDNTQGAKSAKTWSELAITHANNSAAYALASNNSAKESAIQAKASESSAASAASFEAKARTSATEARQSADTATSKLAQLESVDLAKKANIASPTFTGVPKTPTAPSGTNTTQIANTAFVQAAISALVDSSPEALDTLKELASALGNDPNFSTTITNLIGTKLDKTANAVSATKATQDASGNVITTTYATKSELTAKLGALSTVASSGKYTDLLERPTIPSKTSQLTNDSRYVSQDTSGNVTISGTLTAAKVVNAFYNDYAEFFPRGEETTAGDIIALADESSKEVYVKATDRSSFVVGVHSDEYAQIIGGETDADGNFNMENVLKRYIPVALAGRVHVKFYGIAKPGMKVVPSDIPGVGRAFATGDDPDTVIGRIVKGDNYQNMRKVKIMVGR